MGQVGRGGYPKRKQKHLNLNLAEYLVNGLELLELETERTMAIVIVIMIAVRTV